MAYTGGAFFLGLILANILGFNFGVVLGIVCLLAALGIGIFSASSRCKMWAIPCFSAFLACLLFCLAIGIYAKPIERELDGKTVNVMATVTEISSTSDGVAVYTVKSEVPFSDGKTRNVKYKFYYAEDIECEPYDVLNCNMEFSALDNEYEDSNYAKNIFIKAKCVSPIEVIPTSDKPFLYYTLKCRQNLISIIDEKFDRETGGLICGVMTGDKSFMPSQLKENVRVSGLSHITAVSGLHIGILASVVVSLFNKFRMKKRYSYILSLVPIWLFTLITGASYSTLRSAFMFTVLSCGMIFLRRNDPVSALFSALMVCGITSPFCALDVGLLSSGGATFGLLVLYPGLKRIVDEKLPRKIASNGIVKGVISSFTATLSALTGLIPCTVLFYKTFSPVALIANLLCLPLTTILLTCALLGGVLYSVTVISNPLLFVAGIVSKIIIFLCEIFSSIPFAEISVARSYLSVTLSGILIMTAIALVLGHFPGASKRLTALLAVFCVLCLTLSVLSYNLLNRDRVEVFVIDGNETPCVAVIYKGEVGLFCESFTQDIVKKQSNLLRSLGINRVDYMVIQEKISRNRLEMITDNIRIENFYVHEDLKENFPLVATKGKEVIYSTEKFATQKGLQVEFHRERSEVMIRVSGMNILILNRNINYAEQKFTNANLVVVGKNSMKKLEEVTFSTALCCCKAVGNNEVLEYFCKKDITGVYTGGYGTIRTCINKEGNCSLSRIE